MEFSQKEMRQAWLRADGLRRQFPKAQGAKDRAEISEAMALLLSGADPRYPAGIQMSKTEFDLHDTSRWATIDSSYGKGTRAEALSYAKFLRDRLADTFNPGSEDARYYQNEQLNLLQRRHPHFNGVRLTCIGCRRAT